MAWLTLDEEDNDPALFLAYLIAALQRLNPACGTIAQTILSNPGIGMRQVIGVLINDVLETLPDPFVLILDDLHLITEPAVFVALDYLLERLPPQMHLAVGTRHDPPLTLARLRARGQVAELRLADLRFTLDETTQFLNEKLRLDLSPADLAVLHDRTEGWPAGLRLLAGSLERISTPAGRTAFIQDLAQTDRYVFDFLAEEVLDRQTPQMRTFLLETSILSELTPARCQAVTGRSDAGAILEDLYRRNLFLITVSPLPSPISNLQYPIYRYHALFAEFLRQRLVQEMPERVHDLHRRAAETQTDPHRAVRHYLAAEMWEQAAQAIEQVGFALLQRGLLDTPSGWIHALPIPIRDAHPHLTRLLGACAFWKGDFPTAQPLLERTVEGFQAIGDEAGVGESLADLAISAFLQSDFGRAGALIERALAYPVPPHSRAQLLMSRTWLRLFGGDAARAAADLEAAVALAETGKPEVLLMLAFNLKLQLAALPGGLECLERFCHLAAAHLGEPISPLRAAVEELVSFAHFWRGRLEEAIQVGESALAINEQLGGYPFVGIDAAATVALALVARGDYAAADRFFDRMLRQARQMPLSQAGLAGALWLVGRARWLQACTEPSRSSRLEEARQIYAQMCAAEHPAELLDAPASRLKMQGLLELADRRYVSAKRILRQAVALEQKMPTATVLGGSAHLLLAHLYLVWGRPEEALAELAPVLVECEQHGTPGRVLLEGAAAVPLLRLAAERGVHAVFAAYLLDLLGAGAEPRPVLVPDTGETLTPREVEILRLIVAGASNRAIAERLVITEGTVKGHIHHIFCKLDVTSRTEAAARAHELGLI
jgi:LuxR family maltose regulon positive regulatory protein